jgi:hypothetical protein
MGETFTVGFSPRFYRIAAVCSGVSAVTTLLLIFLPSFYAPGVGFEARMARVHDPAYVLRSWAYLVHPFLTTLAALGVAARLRRVAPGLMATGLLGFLLWGATEAAQQTFTLFAFDRWRVAYLAADESVRATMALRTALYDSIWDAMFVLLLIAFLVGNVLYARATLRLRGLSRWLGVLYIAAALLTLIGLVREIAWPGLPAQIDGWSYPVIQPLARVLIGVWLWREAQERLPLRDAAVPRT